MLQRVSGKVQVNQGIESLNIDLVNKVKNYSSESHILKSLHHIDVPLLFAEETVITDFDIAE